MAFQPRYIADSELLTFGLPLASKQKNIMNLIEASSMLIDEHCGRVEADGVGSLAYTSYTERLELPASRNVVRLSYKPLASVPVATVSALSASGNYFDTGVQANTHYFRDRLSPIVSAKGRYGYGRRDHQIGNIDANYGLNVLQVASYFGGPPEFVDIDPTAIDFDPRNGEIWIPAGLYISQYTEIEIVYNSGFDPRAMPRSIKHACAAIVKNFLGKGGGATGVKSTTMYRGVNVTMESDLIDDNVERLLSNYVGTLAG